MWFKFPPGADQISIEQQNFHSEAEDKDGNKFFRAPDHFAPTILGLSGFSRGEPPEGAPPDLPKSDPQRASEIEKLAAELESARGENQRLRQELGAARRERDELQTRFDDIEAEAAEHESKQMMEAAKVPEPTAQLAPSPKASDVSIKPAEAPTTAPAVSPPASKPAAAAAEIPLSKL